MQPHLVTSLGIGNYRELTYELGGNTTRSRFPAVALARLLALGNGRASVLVTTRAREMWYETLADELRAVGLDPEPIDIPDGRSEQQILDIFSRLVQKDGGLRFKQGESLVLDVTLAMRHLPFVYQAALSYLVGLDGLSLRGIYYGAEALEETPMISLLPQFELIEWYHALSAARKSGDFEGLDAPLTRTLKTLFTRKEGDLALSKARGELRALASAVTACLPVEAGIRAGRLCAAIDAIQEMSEENVVRIPARLALQALARSVEEWALLPPPTDKSRLELTTSELARQLRLCRWYLDRGHVPNALLLLREWMISWVLCIEPWTNQNWMLRDERLPIEHYLNGLEARSTLGLASETEVKVSALWSRIRDMRNRLAHAGMTHLDVHIPHESVEGPLRGCESLLTLTEVPPPSKLIEGRLAITSLGLSPGVLYSVVRQLQPAHVIVLTSEKACERLADALRAAGAEALPVTPRILADPFHCFSEACKLEKDMELRLLMTQFREVVVNMTGGTTAMQFGIERLGAEARRLGARVRTVALIDRRSAEEQKARPYVEGEPVWLDALKETEEAGGRA